MRRFNFKVASILLLKSSCLNKKKTQIIYYSQQMTFVENMQEKKKSTVRKLTTLQLLVENGPIRQNSEAFFKIKKSSESR